VRDTHTDGNWVPSGKKVLRGWAKPPPISKLKMIINLPLQPSTPAGQSIGRGASPPFRHDAFDIEGLQLQRKILHAEQELIRGVTGRPEQPVNYFPFLNEEENSLCLAVAVS